MRKYSVFCQEIYLRWSKFIKTNSSDMEINENDREKHVYFICISAVHIISFGVSFFSGVDELNRLVFIGQLLEHCSAIELRGHGFESR